MRLCVYLWTVELYVVDGRWWLIDLWVWRLQSWDTRRLLFTPTHCLLKGMILFNWEMFIQIVIISICILRCKSSLSCFFIFIIWVVLEKRSRLQEFHIRFSSKHFLKKILEASWATKISFAFVMDTSFLISPGFGPDLTSLCSEPDVPEQASYFLYHWGRNLKKAPLLSWNT